MDEPFALGFGDIVLVRNGQFRGMFKVAYTPQHDERFPACDYYFQTESEARLWRNDMQGLVEEIRAIRDNGNATYDDWLTHVYAMREIWSSSLVPTDIWILTNFVEYILERPATDWTIERFTRLD